MAGGDRPRSRDRRYWAFQANPETYDIEEAVQSLAYDTWTTKRSDVRAGDRALIWKSAGGTPIRGIVALAEVLENPALGVDPGSAFWLVDPSREDEPRVPVRYVVPPRCPVWVTPETQSVLQTLSVWRAQGTVFRVTPEQWAKVVELAGGWPLPAEREIQVEADALGHDGLFEPASIIDARVHTIRSIAVRQGRAPFRAALVEAYGGACAISGCRVSHVLEAAHIMPYRGPETNHVTNGLLLRSDLHTLFDLGLITVNSETLEVEVADAIGGTEYGALAGLPLRAPIRPVAAPSRAALDRHRSLSQIGGAE